MFSIMSQGNSAPIITELNNNTNSDKMRSFQLGKQTGLAKTTNGFGNVGKTDSKHVSTPKAAKASKKLFISSTTTAAAVAAAAAKAGRPAMELYKPPGMRHNGFGSAAKSAEDLTSSLSTKPSAAGTKQLCNVFDANTAAFYNASNSNSPHGYIYSQSQPFSQQNNSYVQLYYQDVRNYSKQSNGLEREKSKSQKSLVSQSQTGGRRMDDFNEKVRRSQTPPPSLAIARQMSCPDNSAKSGDEAGTGAVKLKRQRSFIKEQPKKKSSFGDKEAEEARIILMALEMAQDEGISQWIASNYATNDVANMVGQVLVKLAIEHNKSTKLITKVSSLLMECPSGESFHKGLVTSCNQYFDCRIVLRAEHFRFWLNFMNFLSELHANIGFTYESELSQILFQLYDYLLQEPVLGQLKIEELESLISSLLNVGYDLERQCPDRFTELRTTLRNAFIAAHEPWARKMILLLIELSASGCKLSADASEYYFQTSTASVSA